MPARPTTAVRAHRAVPVRGIVLAALAAALVIGAVWVAGGSGSGIGDGVIWEETLGQGVVSDPVLSWTRSCGLDPYEYRHLCHEQGWELKMDVPNEVVEEVILYPAGNSDSIAAYTGPMPLGLGWDDTVGTAVERLGDPVGYFGGNGQNVYLEYGGLDPYYVLVELKVFHVDQVDETVGINSIHVGRGY
jgi:hypothetical protein